MQVPVGCILLQTTLSSLLWTFRSQQAVQVYTTFECGTQMILVLGEEWCYNTVA